MRTLLSIILFFLLSAQGSRAQTYVDHTDYSDPLSYCNQVATIDHPDSRYTGPKATEAMAKLFQRTLSQGGTYEWRCSKRRVLVCLVINAPVCGKALLGVSKGITEFCAANPNADIVPAAVAGRDTEWICSGTQPTIKNAPELDFRGFNSAYWKAMPRALATARATSGPAKPNASNTSDDIELEPGTYVQKATPCEQAANATIMNFDGLQFFGGRFCPASVKGKSGEQLSITRPCETEGPGQSRTDTFLIENPTAFTLKNEFGAFAFRFCEQASLPEIWRGQVKISGNAAQTARKETTLPAPQQKRDIFGIRVGSPAETVDVALRQKPECQLQGAGANSSLTIKCPDALIKVEVAQALQPPLVISVSTTFCDTHSGEALARSIGQQFGLTGFQWTQQFMQNSAEARLDGGSTILALRTEMYSACNNGAGFILVLSDERMRQANQAAAARAREAAPIRRF